MKRHLSAVFVVLVLLVALLPTLGGCEATTNQTSATVWGVATGKATEAAALAEEALAGITKSSAIKVPSTANAGQLLVGCDSVSPPLEFRAYIMTVENSENVKPKQTQIVGFEADLCLAIAKKLGLELGFTTISWSDLTSALSEGKVDLVASAMMTSPQMLAGFGASDIYLAADLAICTKVGDELLDGAALKGKIVAVQAGSTAETLVRALEGVTNIRSYPQIVSGFADLKDGKVDAVVGEQPMCQWILANGTGYSTALTITGAIKTDQGYAIWFAKDDKELLAAVNSALQELRAVPEAAPATATTLGATATTLATNVATVGGTTTTLVAAPAKSVYQLLCEKWGLTGN